MQWIAYQNPGGGLFFMEKSTAWLLMLFHLQALDYESKRDYEFRVEVKNTYLDARFIHGLQFKDYATVKVTVEDVDEPPVFTRNPYIIEVHEDTAAGSFVGVVSARDPDADNKPVKYATGHSEKCFDLRQGQTVRAKRHIPPQPPHNKLILFGNEALTIK